MDIQNQQQIPAVPPIQPAPVAPIQPSSDKTLWICIAVFAFILIAGGGYWYWSTQNKTSEEKAVVVTLASQAYENTNIGLKITPPNGWSTDESGILGAIVMFINSEADTDGKNPFPSSISVTTETVPQGTTIEEYAVAGKEVLRKIASGYKETENETVTLNGVSSRIIGGTYTQGVYKIRNLQLFTIIEETAYIVTGSALESAWNKNKDVLRKSMLTLDITEPVSQSSVETYVNQEEKYQLTVPTGWKQTSATDPEDGTKSVTFADDANAQIMTTASAEDVTLQDIITAVSDSYPDIFTDYKIVSKGKTTINGMPAYLIEFTFTESGSPKFHDKAMFLVNGKKSYSVSLVAPDASWETYKNIADEAINSFKLEK